jgi:hypothetical protein
METKLLKIGAILDNINSRKDGSIKMVFESQELGDDEALAVVKMRNRFGWLLFAPNELDERHVPTEPAPLFEDDRSPSQRLRSVFFVRWQQLKSVGKVEASFNEYYRLRMEALIEQEKELLA